MADTDTEIRSQESAKWNGIISGFIGGSVKGILANWKEIMIIISLSVGVYDHFKESSDTKWIGVHLNQKESEIRQIETNSEPLLP